MEYLLLVLVVLFGVSSIAANSGIPYSHEIISESSKYGIPSSLALAQVDNESNFNPLARGQAGEIGLMQMRSVALQDVNAELRTQYTMQDLFDPAINAKVGFKYLDIVRERNGGNLFLAYQAYNTGTTGTAKGIAYANAVFEKSKEY